MENLGDSATLFQFGYRRIMRSILDAQGHDEPLWGGFHAKPVSWMEYMTATAKMLKSEPQTAFKTFAS